MIKLHPALPALPLQPSAWQWLQKYGVEIVVRDSYSTRGGGAWWPGRKLVELLTVQEEAAIHELAHAWWQERRLIGTTAAELMVACVKLSEETDPRYRRATELATTTYTVCGIRRDENSPTGWWMGMYVGPRRRLGDFRRPGQRRHGRPAPTAAIRQALLRGVLRRAGGVAKQMHSNAAIAGNDAGLRAGAHLEGLSTSPG